jgi:hypothetical protein
MKVPHVSGGKADVLEVLNEQQCLELMHSASLGRIAFQAGADVEILPVNYAWDGSIVIFRTGAGTRLERVPRGRASFEVDGWDADELTGWSVVLKGVAREITTGNDPFSKALRGRSVKPLAPGPRDVWIAIYPAEITGRRFRRTMPQPVGGRT